MADMKIHPSDRALHTELPCFCMAFGPYFDFLISRFSLKGKKRFLSTGWDK